MSIVADGLTLPLTNRLRYRRPRWSAARIVAGGQSLADAYYPSTSTLQTNYDYTTMKNTTPTSELVRIEADDPKTHALLCAVMSAERSDTARMNSYEDELAEWKELLTDVYFADRE